MGESGSTETSARDELGEDLGSAAWLLEDSADHLYLEIDPQGRLTRLSRSCEPMLGRTVGELLGRPFDELVHPEDRQASLEAEVVLRLRTAEGGWLWLSGSVKATGDGRRAALLRDCTRELVRERSLIELERVRNMLSRAVGLSSWTLDPVTHAFLISAAPDSLTAGSVECLDDLLAHVHPDDVGDVACTLDGAMRHGGSGAYDSRVMSGDGGWFRYRVTYDTGMNADGLYTVYGLSQDITEQTLARDAAVESADRLRIALNAAQAGVCEMDFKTQAVWCSEEFIQLMGRRLEFPAPGEVPWPMCHPDDRHLVLSATWSGSRHEPIEIRIVLPSGAIRWVELHGERELDEGGETSKIICLALDLDVRKRQELALVEARQEAQANAERLKLAMNAARAGVFDTDLKHGVFWCSPEFIEIVGRRLTFEEAADVWPIIHPEDAAIVRAAIERSEGGSGNEAAEWRILLPSGEYHWIDVRASVRHGADGAVEGLVGVVLDIDVRKRQELALIEAERTAQAAGEAKSQFLANMSHEIRTPMNGVLGVLHLLGKEALSEDGRKLLVEAEQCGKMLSLLLNDVIDFSRIEAGQLELALEPLDVVGLMNGVADLLRPQVEARGLKLLCQSDCEDAWIVGDPVRLRQALFNLLGNAAKFTTKGRIEARLSTRASAPGRTRLRFEIEDTGIGIAEGAQRSLFERFTQADGGINRRFGGSGLGLAITRRLAELMRGEVGFTSREGVGSIFWLEIDAETAAVAASTPSVAEPEGMLASVAILLVEDNPTNQLVARKMLESLGAAVDTANDGLEGLQAVQERSYDLVLMDIQMPQMDGVEATRRIRALKGEVATIPIIALTANVMAHQLESYTAAGMNGVVAKPISPPALIGAIVNAFSDEDSTAEADAG